MNKNGIDISEYQGDIDFNLLKGNIDFAIVRTSIGNFREDKKHKQNIRGLESIEVPYGVYHYSYATNEKVLFSKVPNVSSSMMLFSLIILSIAFLIPSAFNN